MRNPRCELVSGEDISHLEGRLKTFIDSIIPESQVVQNRATKDVIRVILWDWFNFIKSHFADHLLEKRKWYGDVYNVKFKLFPNEHYDQQKEKDNAYEKAGYKLSGQKQEKNGIIKRTYKK